ETSNEPNCTEPLRMLVTTFAALNFTKFRGSEGDDLMMSAEWSDREFVSDFMLKAMQKMNHLEMEYPRSFDRCWKPSEAMLEERRLAKEQAAAEDRKYEQEKEIRIRERMVG
ncbi:MAG: hypothetical protein Q9226_009396, partial [Calogaya cf. arnoldii]